MVENFNTLFICSMFWNNSLINVPMKVGDGLEELWRESELEWERESRQRFGGPKLKKVIKETQKFVDG